MKLRHVKKIPLPICFIYVALFCIGILRNRSSVTSVERIKIGDGRAEWLEGNPSWTKNNKKIVFWTDFFTNRQDWKKIFKRLTDGQCEESRCTITLESADIHSADAVLFNGWNLRFTEDLHSSIARHILPLPQGKRDPRQVYVFYSMEPPTKLDEMYLSTLSNYFNWTMTYRRDSDVYEPFGLVKQRTRASKKAKVFHQSELDAKKMGVWLATRCYVVPPFFRENFVVSLRKYIHIDVLGNCGEQCDNYKGADMYGTQLGDFSCDSKIKDYKFYFSLENSLCKDYISEKVFKAWQLGLIPVVFGGGNYSEIAPPHSYIDYRDFKSLGQLADYLKKVAGSAKLYNEYFKWTKYFKIEMGSPFKPMICDLCKKLHSQETQRKTKTYRGVYEWFSEKSKCKKDFDEFPYDIEVHEQSPYTNKKPPFFTNQILASKPNSHSLYYGRNASFLSHIPKSKTIKFRSKFVL